MYSLSQKIITPYNLKFPNKINFNHKEKKKKLKKDPFPLEKLHDFFTLKLNPSPESV